MAEEPVLPDDDNPEWTEEDFAQAKPIAAFPELEAALKRGRGRPAKPEAERKRMLTMRLSPDVVEAMRASGPGWQVRADEALRRAFTGG